jgi:hypothetical protein
MGTDEEAAGALCAGWTNGGSVSGPFLPQPCESKAKTTIMPRRSCMMHP